jgi:3-dehydroquinate synthase
LNTLPNRELSCGLAEIIKHGAIADESYLADVEQHMSQLLARNPQVLAHIVWRSCEIKAHVVAQDEREAGLRAILNFGHTFGHAIEASLGYGRWYHGEAVGCGMILAAELCQRLGYVTALELTRLKQVVLAAQLPITPPALGVEVFMQAMAHDKKADANGIQYVLLQGLGKAMVQRVDDATVRQLLHDCGVGA